MLREKINEHKRHTTKLELQMRMAHNFCYVFIILPRWC